MGTLPRDKGLSEGEEAAPLGFVVDKPEPGGESPPGDVDNGRPHRKPQTLAHRWGKGPTRDLGLRFWWVPGLRGLKVTHTKGGQGTTTVDFLSFSGQSPELNYNSLKL